MEHKVNKKLMARIARAKVLLDAKWVQQCQQLLTDAGVPEEVTLVGEFASTTTTLPGRLKWYLLRRKDIKPFETETVSSEKRLHDLESMFHPYQASHNEPKKRIHEKEFREREKEYGAQENL